MLRWIARQILKLGGWTVVGKLPPLDKAIFIAAPHTSNWDGFWLLVYKVADRIDVRFLAKDTLFWWPLGAILRALGALPIDRSNPADIVPQLVQEFKKSDRLLLALAPEGTRSWAPHWKTGFHRLASATGVPVVLGFIDYNRKEMGIGPALPPNRTLEEDLAFIKDFFEPKVGRRPELKGPIEFPPA